MSCLAVFLAQLPTIWIVDASNASGTHFTDLPAAVAAAQSGDTLLVRGGHYSAFYVSGKALTIRGDGTVTTIIDMPWPGRTLALPYDFVTIDNTPAGQSFYLSGMALNPPWPNSSSMQPVHPALRVLPGATVTIADCTILGHFIGVSSVPQSGPAASVSGSLHSVRTSFQGGWAGAAVFLQTVVGAAAVEVAATGVFAADQCICQGGHVGGGLVGGGNFTTGSGLVVNGGRATLTRSSCRAGFSSAVSQLPPFIATGSGVLVRGGGTVRISGTAADQCTGVAQGNLRGAGVEAILGGTATVHGAVTLSTGGSTPTIGSVGFAAALPTLTVVGTTLASGETDSALPTTWTVAAPVLTRALSICSTST